MDALRPVVLTIAETVFRAVVIALAVYGALDIARSALAQGKVYLPHVANAAEIETLSERVAELEDKLVHVTREGDDVYVTGANLHVVNGEDETATTNGVGNVIVGYNERSAAPYLNNRRGSHMIVVGSENQFSAYGGIVTGIGNRAEGPWSSITGGRGNEATGAYASISGGESNVASGKLSSVIAGTGNRAVGHGSAVCGGVVNRAVGPFASVTGGEGNEAVGDYASSVSGGLYNKALADHASVSGGFRNVASGNAATVSGGQQREATGVSNWAAGDLFQDH